MRRIDQDLKSAGKLADEKNPENSRTSDDEARSKRMRKKSGLRSLTSARCGANQFSYANEKREGNIIPRSFDKKRNCMLAREEKKFISFVIPSDKSHE